MPQEGGMVGVVPRVAGRNVLSLTLLRVAGMGIINAD